ncbi:hypothetical protein MNQ95_06900 [Pseudoxanthomonas daejeonensis]|nr:hypothetical protein [Pseudoxanthomonas daejeonensis]UNK58806.1 hypothetical protein MNQ95_06900 [Pseudoxanthomonas daejeonensis]
MFRLCAILLSLLPGASVDIARPGPFAFGSSVAQAQQRPAPLCTSLEIRVLTPPTAPLARISRHPVDCAGFVHADRPRTVELVFQDYRLDLVWILFPAQRKTELLQAFSTRYGKPSLEVEFGSIYLAASAAARNAPNGALFASERQARAMMARLQAQAAAASPSTSP